MSNQCPKCHKHTLLFDEERLYCVLCTYTVWINPRTDLTPTTSLKLSHAIQDGLYVK